MPTGLPPIANNQNNSFVTFYNGAGASVQKYPTVDVCGINQDICYPVYNGSDISFQFLIVTDEGDALTKLTGTQIYTTPDAEVLPEYLVTGATITVEDLGSELFAVYVNLAASDFTNSYEDGECFIISLQNSEDWIGSAWSLFSNQCFRKITDKCHTTRISYVNSENAFGFYTTIGLTTATNNIRLPVYLKNPELPVEKKVYKRSNGVTELLTARYWKKYLCLVDMLDEPSHQKLQIALGCDTIFFFLDNGYTFGAVFEDEEYTNEFPSTMQRVNTWPASFYISETPIQAVNNNCG